MIDQGQKVIEVEILIKTIHLIVLEEEEEEEEDGLKVNLWNLNKNLKIINIYYINKKY